MSLICGPNGQGKTSILEALFVAAHARSFRTSRLKEAIAWGSKEAQLCLEVETEDGGKSLYCKFGSNKREIRINDNPIQRASDYYGQCACIAFTPESLQIVQGSPQVRRRFIDRAQTMLDPHYVELVVKYQRALKSRNILLQELRRTGGSLHSAEWQSQFDAWESILATVGASISIRRDALLTRLNPATQRYYSLLSQGREQIELVYKSRAIEAAGERNLEEALREELAATRSSDMQRQTTSLGPHRDDVEVYLTFGAQTQLAREAASQGQARTAALALTLAVIEAVRDDRAEAPIVLLDDVESELDAHRRHALFTLLADYQSQTIISATEPTELRKLCGEQLEVLSVSKGKVEH